MGINHFGPSAWPFLFVIDSCCVLFHDIVDEGCEPWKNEHIVLIDTDKTDSRYIFYEGKYKSCYLESFISYLNGTTGEWQLFNSSGNVFVMENDPDTRSSQIKVFY